MDPNRATAESSADDCDGRAALSLAAVLARLSLDSRSDLARCRLADDALSLDVNVDDSASCCLSDVSGVSSTSCLNELAGGPDDVDDEHSGGRPDSERDDDDEDDDLDEDGDVDDNEDVEAMLLQHCLEAELLERHWIGEVGYDCNNCSVSCDTTLDDIAAIMDNVENDEGDTETMKRTSRKDDNTVLPDHPMVIDVDASPAKDARVNMRKSLSPRRGDGVVSVQMGSKKNPDMKLCAVWGDELVSGRNARKTNSRNGARISNGNSKHSKSQAESLAKPQQPQFAGSEGRCSTTSLTPNALNSENKTSRRSPTAEIQINHTKHRTSKVIASQIPVNNNDVHSNEHDYGIRQSTEPQVVLSSSENGLGEMQATSPLCMRKPVSPSSSAASVETITAGRNHVANKQQLNHRTDERDSSGSADSTPVTKPTLPSCEITDESLIDVPLGDAKRTLSLETDADSIDAVSVVSDDVDKVSSVAGAVVMPSVEDGLSSSDISDVEEALSVPMPAVPRSNHRSPSVRTPTALNSLSGSDGLQKDNDRCTPPVDDTTPVVEDISASFESAWIHMSALRKSSDDTAGQVSSHACRHDSESSTTDLFNGPGHKSSKADALPGSQNSQGSPQPQPLDGIEKSDELTQSSSNGSVPAGIKPQPAYEGERESFLIEGVLFRARYLGSTQLISEGQPSKAVRMMQAQEAIGRIKQKASEQPAAGTANQPSTLVDLFVSVEKIMVLNTDLQEIMMDHALRTISYIADIGDLLVVMARRGPVNSSPSGTPSTSSTSSLATHNQTKICCHVFESDEAQLIAQSISQAFQVAYMEFLKANGINDPDLMKEMDYQDVLSQQAIFGEELFLFSNKDMQKEIIIPKLKNEPLGVVIVESGWGSMVPTIVLASMAPGGAAARCGQLNIGDQIMSINGVSLVGLPLSTCQNYMKAVRSEILVRLLVVSCTPVVEVLVKRPDIKYQLGFSVQNGVICSLLRGGIAERGGVRVGHRIIEINGQSVVAVPHEKIVSMLATSVGEIHMKTMQTSIYRLLTGQDTPHYI